MSSRAGATLGIAIVAVLLMALVAGLWVMTGTPSWYDQLSLALGFLLAGASGVLAVLSIPHASAPKESNVEKWARYCLAAAFVIVAIRGLLVAIFK